MYLSEYWQFSPAIYINYMSLDRKNVFIKQIFSSSNLGKSKSRQAFSWADWNNAENSIGLIELGKAQISTTTNEFFCYVVSWQMLTLISWQMDIWKMDAKVSAWSNGISDITLGFSFWSWYSLGAVNRHKLYQLSARF